MADKRWRGALFDAFVALLLVAVASGPILWAAGVMHRAARAGFKAVGLL